jgi:predicted acyltransferase
VAPTLPVNERLLSLDFFRGFTIAAMILVNNPGSWSHVYPPLLHAEWHGCTLTDLIFPYFLFIVGVSITLAFASKKANKTPAKDLYSRILRRSFLLFALGLFLSGFPSYDLASIRIPGVLQRIAVCYFFATVIFLHSDVKTQAIWAIGLMLIYWAVMQWYPLAGVAAGSYAKGANFSAWLDNTLLSGHMWSQTKTWDPEGVFSTLPAISTTLMGVLTGQLLRLKKSPVNKVGLMFLLGGIAIVAGWLWSFYLPLNKSLWTSSYALFTGGLAMVTLATCIYIVDIKAWQKGTLPFRIYGMNAITVYVLSGVTARLLYLIKWQSGEQVISLKTWLMDSLFLPLFSPINASLAFGLCFVFMSYLFALYLYKKQIFIKV